MAEQGETKTLEVVNCVPQPAPSCQSPSCQPLSCDLDFYLLGWLYTRASLTPDKAHVVAEFARNERTGLGKCPAFIFNKLIERLKVLECAVAVQPGMVVRLSTDNALCSVLVKMLELQSTPTPSSFVRGVYDSAGTLYCTTGKVSCRLTLPRSLRAIINSTIPAIHTECNDRFVQYEDTNALDFLGQVYRGCSDDKDLLRNTVKFNRYIYAMKCCVHEFDRLPTVKFRLVNENALVPEQFRVSDVGFDLSVISKVRDLGSNMALYDTGIQVTPPHGFYLEVIPRSSISKSGYMMLNSIGVIDPAYTGSIMIALVKIDLAKPDITFPTRCAQLVMRRLYHFGLLKVEDIAETERASGGFGSTNNAQPL